MAIYFLDNDQKLLKIVPNNGAISILQTQELPDDNSLLKDTLSVRLKNDERLFDAQYMAIKSYDGNRNSFDMYRIINELVPDNATEFEGMQVAPYELEGVIVEDMRPQNWTVERTVNQILQDSDWRLGYIERDLPSVTTNFYYLSAKDSLKKLQELLGIEITFKVEISGNRVTDKWIEVYKQLGNRTLKRFNYGTNALTVKRETSSTELYTGLIGRGKGEEVGETDAGDATYGRKITFEDIEWSKANGDPVDKPKGQKYIELPEATTEFGIKLLDGRKVPRIGIVEFPDTEEPEVLIKETWQALQSYARPKVLFSAVVANIGDTGIGDTVTIHRHDLNMHYEPRVRKVMRDRKNNNKTQVEIGDVVYTPSTKRQANINSALNNMQDELGDVRGEVTYARRSADGKNTNFYGNEEPERKRVGDTWFRDHPSLVGEKQILIWNGEAWVLEVDTSETTKNADAIAQQQQELNEVKQTADEAVDRINGEIADKFNGIEVELVNVEELSSTAYSNALVSLDHSLDALALAGQAIESTGSLSVRVDDVENELSIKADKQTVDDLEHVVNLQALDIKANSDGLALKANQDAVDLLSGTVSSLGTDIGVVAGQVNSRVWNTDIESAIDGLSYENRNLIKNSDFSQGKAHWESTPEIKTEGYLKYITQPYGWATSYKYKVSEGEYTLSVLVRLPNNAISGTFRMTQNIKDKNGNELEPTRNVYIYPPKTDGWVRVSTSFVLPEGVNEISGYYLSNNEAPIDMTEFKLEKGSKATDWSPAPEDTLARFDHIETEWTQTFDSFAQSVAHIDGRVTNIRQDVDSMAGTVTDHTGKIASIEFNISGIQTSVADKASQSQVTQLANLVDTKVTSSQVNALIKSDKTIKDTRDDNETPEWYQVRYPRETVREFKRNSTIGISGEGTYGVLETAVPWFNPTGGGVKQTLTTDYSVWERSGSGTTWNEWKKIADVDWVGAQISVLEDNINLRVSKGELLSQINIEAGRTLIQSDRLYLDANSVIFSGNAFIPSAAIQNLTADKITTGTLFGNNVTASGINVDTLVGNKAELIQLGFNGINSWMYLDADGIHMSGSGSWRRTYLSPTGFDLYNGAGGSNKAGAIGYFKSTVSESTYDENIMAGNEGSKHSLGIGVNSTHNIVLGYNDRSDTNRVFKRAIQVDGDTGNLRFYSTIFPGSSEYGLEFVAHDRTPYFGPAWQTESSGVLFGRSGTYIWDESAGNWDNYNMTTRQRIGFYGESGIQVLTSNRNMELWAGGSAIRFYTSNSSERFRVGDGSINAFTDLNMNSNSIFNQSDERLKTKISLHTESSLDKIMDFNFVDFTWIEDNREDFGVIAQQIQQIAPELISETEEGFLNLNNTRLAMMTTHAVQQLAFAHEGTKTLALSNEEKIHQLQKELSKANRKIEELEGMIV